MIYKPGDKVKFKIGHSIKNGVILEKITLDYPYHVKSDDNNDYWISEDSIVEEESKLKYKVGDRVIFDFEYSCFEHTGTIVRVEDGKHPYKIRDDHNGSTYFANDDNILGYRNSRNTDYTVFYGGRRPGKSVLDKMISESTKPRWDALPDEGPLYSKKDVEVLEKMYSRIMCTGAYLPKIKKVIFNDPATIVFWEDGTKTVVKAQTSVVSGYAFINGQTLVDLTETDLFDPEKGLAMAIAKKALGNNHAYYNTFKKWLPKEEKNDKKNRR